MVFRMIRRKIESPGRCPFAFCGIEPAISYEPRMVNTTPSMILFLQCVFRRGLAHSWLLALAVPAATLATLLRSRPRQLRNPGVRI